MTLIDIIWQRHQDHKPTARRINHADRVFSGYMPQHNHLMEWPYSLDQIAYITRRNRFVYVRRRSWPVMRYYPTNTEAQQ